MHKGLLPLRRVKVEVSGPLPEARCLPLASQLAASQSGHLLGLDRRPDQRQSTVTAKTISAGISHGKSSARGFCQSPRVVFLFRDPIHHDKIAIAMGCFDQRPAPKSGAISLSRQGELLRKIAAGVRQRYQELIEANYRSNLLFFLYSIFSLCKNACLVEFF